MSSDDYHLKVIVLGAGNSERFGDIKLLAKVKLSDESLSLVEHVLQRISAALNLLGISTANIHLTTGRYHQQISTRLGKQFPLIYCQDAHLGLGHTIAQSVKEITSTTSKNKSKNERDVNHIMVILADQIALETNDYMHLIEQSLKSPAQIICAKAMQKMMPPAIFPYHYFPDLMALHGDKGAKALLDKNKEKLQTIAMPNAIVDIDTKQDLLNWQNKT
ncbi:MAG: nucleotidyltransferase family protein [Colwellia sp.]|nr:nucleotidyltransferase family protein [Colwellia sp.]